MNTALPHPMCLCGGVLTPAQAHGKARGHGDDGPRRAEWPRLLCVRPLRVNPICPSVTAQDVVVSRGSTLPARPQNVVVVILSRNEVSAVPAVRRPGNAERPPPLQVAVPVVLVYRFSRRPDLAEKGRLSVSSRSHEGRRVLNAGCGRAVLRGKSTTRC